MREKEYTRVVPSKQPSYQKTHRKRRKRRRSNPDYESYKESQERSGHDQIRHRGRKAVIVGSDVRKRVHKEKRTANQETSLTKSLGKKGLALIWSLLFYVITFGIIVTSILFAFSDSEEKNLFGYRILGVLTDSMSPQKDSPSGGFYAGDVIIVKDIPGDGAKVGEVLTYHPNIESKTFLTHRVVKKMDELEGDPGPFYITKGDANNTEDVPIHAKQVVGKTVFVLPKIGSVLSFVRDNFIISTIFIVSLFGFIVVMRMYFFNN